MKDNRVFVDTNVFIYIIMEDERSAHKHNSAVSLFQKLTDQIVFINTQVINEIYSVMLKHGIDDKAIQDKLAVSFEKQKYHLSILKRSKNVGMCA
jgi:Predicted nucleic-acid-binding protein, contains PIN domain